MMMKLFNDAVSTTRLFSVDGIGDSDVVFGNMRPSIRYGLPDIRLTDEENLGKPNQSRSCVLTSSHSHKSRLLVEHALYMDDPRVWRESHPPLLAGSNVGLVLVLCDISYNRARTALIVSRSSGSDIVNGTSVDSSVSERSDDSEADNGWSETDHVPILEQFLG
ncbi:hypothetical protein ANN_00917 [Periplaneta americana]|uniref:Uncharacterized protein n=1 Tax=Periplaneta americana TaxID=6978 RepID=A0ABQ8TS56_PERAM|nr:hypothetical protein ANN_00917 [Periplaneta americana]